MNSITKSPHCFYSLYFSFYFYWYWYLQSVRVIVQNRSNLTRVCLFPNPANNNQLQSNGSLSLSFSLPEDSSSTAILGHWEKRREFPWNLVEPAQVKHAMDLPASTRWQIKRKTSTHLLNPEISHYLANSIIPNSTYFPSWTTRFFYAYL